MASFDGGPDEGDIISASGVRGDLSCFFGTSFEVDGGIFGQGVGGCSNWDAKVVARNIVRIDGGAIGFDVGEVSPSSGGEFWGDTKADVVFVEVEVGVCSSK